MNITINKLLKKKLIETRNESSLSKYIMVFLENKCNICNKIVDSELTYIISFEDGPKNFYFQDLPNSKLKFKKVCKRCLCTKTTSVKIYVEI